mgnify:FL=1|jgi:hypothetical protein|tara:strand:- start:1026 stop:1289 length:264 start_codon:yes stop_codon:yes gene_type:complete
MSEFEIRTGVPLPRKQSSKMLDLPFDQMEIGDSFEVSELDQPDEVREKKGGAEARIRSAAYRNGSRLSKRFAVRRIDRITLGVWRTE